MEYRTFGNTSLEVSEIGFGAWAIGGAANVGGVEIGWGSSDDAESKAAVLSALDAGINFFDTADFYGLGHSETLLGTCIGKNKEALIATKVGQKVSIEGTIQIDYSKDYIIEACEASLKRLQRETIDFYQLHVARLAHLQDGACIEAMEQLKKDGKIRYWGLSLNTFAPGTEANFLLEGGFGSGFQLVLNMINQIAVPLLEPAAAKGMGIIARMPLQFGLLSGKYKPDARFDQSDHRHKRLTPVIIERTIDILRADVVPLAKQYNTNLAGMALSFILGFPQVSTVIPGIRNPDQVHKNTSSLVKLSANDHQYLRDLFDGKWKVLLDIIQKQG